MQNKKILIYQPKQIGDVLLCTPLIRAIKMQLPNAEIHFVTTEFCSKVLLNNPYIHKIHTIPQKGSWFSQLKFYFNLRKINIDVVFDLMSHNKSVLLTQILCANKYYAVRKRYGGVFSTKIINESQNPFHYTVYSKLLFFTEWLKKTGRADLVPKKLLEYSQDLDIFLTESEQKFVKQFTKKYCVSSADTIALNPVSRRDYKIWGAENFAKIVVYLLEKNKQILFLYGPGEQELAYNVLKLLPKKYQDDKRILIDYDFINIRHLYGVLQSCKAYLGNDGGPKHIACAAQIPTVTIFKNINPKNWTPVHDPRHKALHADNLSLAEIILQLEKIL